ncbi:DUF1963 domain-containing protein [Flagellimonas meishanensis]|uniref:DUF1963 domain-containing protein n=1 Tax=Flagellimonas meishanensis TaxID=2873264 RepID=UPI001CA6F898|nr:DUF1963 domain-containing protein [[Muricauda] meishanensis]
MKKEEIATILDSLRKPAYLPQLVHNESGPQFSAHSKYNGFPYLRHEEDWPSCPICNRLMPLIFQLNLSEMPIQKKENRLVQCFQCLNLRADGSRCELEYPKLRGAVLRSLDTVGASAHIPVDFDQFFESHSSFLDILWQKMQNEVVIASWQQVDDYPSGVDFNEKMDYLADQIGETTLDFIWDNIGLLDECGDKKCISRDKLFGYPCWDQTEAYPKTAAAIDQLLFQYNGILTSKIATVTFPNGETGKLFQDRESNQFSFVVG